MIDEATAGRLVNELMLVSALVAGEGAATVAAALQEAGAAADTFETRQPGSYDLAIYLAPAQIKAAGGARIEAELAEASDRVLLVPAASEAASALDHMTAWFEFFVERGFQPVVDFDAGFIAAGAFLVDRGATAGEEELAAFTERLQAPPGPAVQALAAEPPAGAPPPDGRDVTADLHARIDEQDAVIAALQSRVAEAEASAQNDAAFGNAAQDTGWDGLRGWVAAEVRDTRRDTPIALLRDLPRLNALRGGVMPPLTFAAPAPARRGLWARLFGPPAKPASDRTSSALEDAALVRASPYFDPAWYIASSVELSAGETVDPVFHYLFVGGPRGGDPGPYFDSEAYLAAHPEAQTSGQAPLLHAIRTKAAEVSDGAAAESAGGAHAAIA